MKFDRACLPQTHPTPKKLDFFNFNHGDGWFFPCEINLRYFSMAGFLIFPKLDKTPKKEVRHTVNRLNNRLRKTLNFKTAYDLISKYRAELAA